MAVGISDRNITVLGASLLAIGYYLNVVDATLLKFCVGILILKFTDQISYRDE